MGKCKDPLQINGFTGDKAPKQVSLVFGRDSSLISGHTPLYPFGAHAFPGLRLHVLVIAQSSTGVCFLGSQTPPQQNIHCDRVPPQALFRTQASEAQEAKALPYRVCVTSVLPMERHAPTTTW